MLYRIGALLVLAALAAYVGSIVVIIDADNCWMENTKAPHFCTHCDLTNLPESQREHRCSTNVCYLCSQQYGHDMGECCACHDNWFDSCVAAVGGLKRGHHRGLSGNRFRSRLYSRKHSFRFY